MPQRSATADLAKPAKPKPAKPKPADGKGQPKGQRGPPLANINAGRNGTRLTRLTLGELPKTMRRQLQNARKYRRFLEGMVMDAHSEVNATAAHLIDEATCAEVHSAVCRWLLRTRLETMTVGDITRCSEQIVKAKTIRNKAVTALKIDAEPEPVSLASYVVDSGSNKAIVDKANGK